MKKNYADTVVPSSSSNQTQAAVKSFVTLPSRASSAASQRQSLLPQSSSASQLLSSFEKPMVAAEDLATSKDVTSATVATKTVVVERRVEYATVCKWAMANFPKIKARALWSKYFEVGGYDCRLLIYPKGDSQALPGYISIYLQIMDPRNMTSSKWDCFASYRLFAEHPMDPSKSIHKDS